VRLEVWPLHLALEDADLVAKNQDLDLLASSERNAMTTSSIRRRSPQ
jgi:hypothetical protein